MDKHPTTIDWRITTKCDNKCPFCYASAEIEALDKVQIKKIFEKIKDINPNNICISGGEPTINSNFEIILQNAIDMNLGVYISTNGANFFKKTVKFINNISKLSLPLDGFDEASYSINGRKKSGFSRIIEILDYLQANEHSCKIKITTMLTKNNANTEFFEKIFLLLKEYNIDFWKIYQFVPEGRGAINKNKFLINDTDYDIIKNYIKSLEKKYKPNFKIDFPKRTERNAAYFIIQPNGSVIVPIESENQQVIEYDLGNLLEDSLTEILALWNKKIDINNYEKTVLRRGTGFFLQSVDKKIISEIDHNPFITNDELTKILNISVGDVISRIGLIYSQKAIKQTIPIINVTKFGLGIHLANLIFPNCYLKKQEIINYLAQDKHTCWLVECENTNDTVKNAHLYLRIGVFVRGQGINSSDLTFEQLIAKHSEKFPELCYEVNNVYKKFIREQKFILEEQEDRKYISYDKIDLVSDNIFSVTRKEFTVLSALAELGKIGRISYEKLSRKTNLKEKELKQIINNLKQNKIINKFQVVLDTQIIDYAWYLYFLKFKAPFNQDSFVAAINADEREAKENFAKTLKITHINCLEGGEWHLDFEIKVKDNNEKIEFDNYLFDKHKGQIGEKKIFKIIKEYKFEFLTPLLFSKMHFN